MINLRNLFLISIAAAVFSVSSATDDAPLAHQLNEDYTFEQYLSHFSKSYDDHNEYTRREKLFNKNMATILAHNKGKMTEDGHLLKGGYVMGVNQFTDVDHNSELPMGYNKLQHPAWKSQFVGLSKTERKLGEADTQQYSKPSDFQVDDVSSLPVEVDWVKEGKLAPVVNQGGCGSCWTFAATATIESHLAIETGDDPVPLSEQNMLQCAPNPDDCGGTGQCKGATVELGLNYIADLSTKKTGGMFKVEDVPYSPDPMTLSEKCAEITKDKSPHAGITGWTQLPANDYKTTMNAIAKVGPVAIAVAANWGMYEKGVFSPETTTPADATVNHAVVLVGYGVDKVTGEKYYKIRNSWGPGFGEDGYIRILRTDDDDNLCQTDTDPLVGIACALDDNGNKVDVKPPKVCGTSAILFDVSYPTGAHKIE